PNGQVNVAYPGATLSASGGLGSLTWSITPGSLPDGLTLNTSSGAISGTPTASGPFNFTVNVSDSKGKGASKPLSIAVASQPSISTTSLNGGQVGVAYSQGVSASGGAGSLTYSISNGNLPGGLGINSSSGVISGTPTGNGTSNFTVKVTDANSQTATKNLSINIASQPTIGTTSLNGGEVGVAYSQGVSASGGVGSLTYSISNGNLPAGLGINSSSGVISGTPTSNGT